MKMNNIERILEEIIIADVEPDEDLVRETKHECKKIEKEIRLANFESRIKKSKITVRFVITSYSIHYTKLYERRIPEKGRL